MTYRLPLLAALLCLGGILPGCTVCQLARVVSLDEPRLFDRKEDRKVSLATYRALADEAWATTGACCPDGCASEDYAWGFREGFSEFVYAGGSGEPPVLPPRSYWQSDNRTSEGAAAVRSWFQGYRYGVQVAREGGYRQAATVVVSASVRDCDACGKPDGCGKTDCESCESGNGDAVMTFPTVGPALQQPELQRLEEPFRTEKRDEERALEVMPPVPERVPLPRPVVQPSERSIEEEHAEEEHDLQQLLEQEFWTPKESPPLDRQTMAIPQQPLPSDRTENRPAEWVPVQKNPVTQAFFPIVR